MIIKYPHPKQCLCSAVADIHGIKRAAAFDGRSIVHVQRAVNCAVVGQQRAVQFDRAGRRRQRTAVGDRHPAAAPDQEGRAGVGERARAADVDVAGVVPGVGGDGSVGVERAERV